MVDNKVGEKEGKKPKKASRIFLACATIPLLIGSGYYVNAYQYEQALKTHVEELTSYSENLSVLVNKVETKEWTEDEIKQLDHIKAEAQKIDVTLLTLLPGKLTLLALDVDNRRYDEWQTKVEAYAIESGAIDREAEAFNARKTALKTLIAEKVDFIRIEQAYMQLEAENATIKANHAQREQERQAREEAERVAAEEAARAQQAQSRPSSGGWSGGSSGGSSSGGGSLAGGSSGSGSWWGDNITQEFLDSLDHSDCTGKTMMEDGTTCF